MPSGPTVVELAELSSAAYADRGNASFPHPPDGGLGVSAIVEWRRTSSWSNKVGFYAALFTRAGRSPVLAYRGTDDGWDGAVDDLGIAVGSVPPQAAAALFVAREAALGDGGYITGHSLGGALSLIVASQASKPVVSFNAPGVADSCLIAAPAAGLSLFQVAARCLSNPHSMNIRINGDPVSSFLSTGFQAGAGRTTLEAPQCGWNALCRHGIKTCISAVRLERRYYQPLKL